jgi:hypothetical protein
MSMQLFEDLFKALQRFSDRNAFMINASFYTYSDLTKVVSALRVAAIPGIMRTKKTSCLI